MTNITTDELKERIAESKSGTLISLKIYEEEGDLYHLSVVTMCRRKLEAEKLLLEKMDRLNRAEELIENLISNQDISGYYKIKFCRFCNRKLSNGHWVGCKVTEAKSFLAEDEV